MMILTTFFTSKVHAQYRLGVKGGVNISTVKFNTNLFDANNITDFHIGPMAEYMLKSNLGVDVALLFTQKGFQYKDETIKNAYIEVPVNLKMKMRIWRISPYIAAGPYVSFLIAGEKEKNIIVTVNEIFGKSGILKAKNFGAGVNFTAGVELLNRIQISGTYNWGFTDIYDKFKIKETVTYGKAHTWMISAAFMF